MTDIEMVDHVRIPEDRVGVLIGKNGETKRKIEKETTADLDISSEGRVIIKASEKTKDPTELWKARDIVKAIGRGFSAKRAMPLLEDYFYLEVLILTGSEKRKRRLKGRIIGENGFTRKTIETHTNCSVSVYGKTVAMIGELENLKVCKKAIYMLVEGAPHSQVYKMLEQYRLQQKTKKPTLWRKPY